MISATPDVLRIGLPVLNEHNLRYGLVTIYRSSIIKDLPKLLSPTGFDEATAGGAIGLLLLLV